MKNNNIVSASLLLLLASTIQVKADTHLGCYANLPSSFSATSTYQWQTSSYCSNTCKGYSFFALQNGGTCICGNDAPDGGSNQVNTCSSTCFGYNEETCGGSSSYDVYVIGNGPVPGLVSNSPTTTTLQSSTQSTNNQPKSTNEQTTQQTQPTSNTQVTQTTIITAQDTSTRTIISNVQPTESNSLSNSSQSSSNGSSNNNKKSVIGPAVGGAVGGVVGITLIILLVFLIKRRQDKNKKEAELADSAYFSAIKRDNTFSSTQRPISNPFITKDEIMVDQRLNPVMINSRRRISEGSLADEADYSRKILTVANPDDE